MGDLFSNGRVGIDEDGDEVASPEYAFGTGMLSYIDSLFFYLPFASASQADKARSEADVELEVWERHRDNLMRDHEALRWGTRGAQNLVEGLIRGMPRQYLWRVGVLLLTRQKLPSWQRKSSLFVVFSLEISNPENFVILFAKLE